MGYVYMKEVPYNTQDAKNYAFELKLEVDTATTTDWVIIPDQVVGIVGQVKVTGSATAYVEATTSTLAEIIEDTAVPDKWPFPDVTTANSPVTQESSPVSAVRGVMTGTGTAYFSLRVQ